MIEMDAASNNSVDDIRDLRERVAFAPVAGRHKVYILDEAHMLSTAAWNAFLKTLEEPPPHTIFVLATTEANKVLPTVVDRCHRFDFARPSVPQIAERAAPRRRRARRSRSPTRRSRWSPARPPARSATRSGTLEQLRRLLGPDDRARRRARRARRGRRRPAVRRRRRGRRRRRARGAARRRPAGRVRARPRPLLRRPRGARARR